MYYCTMPVPDPGGGGGLGAGVLTRRGRGECPKKIWVFWVVLGVLGWCGVFNGPHDGYANRSNSQTSLPRAIGSPTDSRTVLPRAVG